MTTPAAGIPGPLPGIRRIVFLGDSITQGGDYVTDIECWLLSRGLALEVIDVGLSSETATDLTDEEKADIVDGTGARFNEVVEPRSGYFVGRLARDYRNGLTQVGLFSTAVLRDLPDNANGKSPLCKVPISGAEPSAAAFAL